MNLHNCAHCNTPVVFAQTPEGKTITLDVLAPIYLLDGEGDQLTVKRVHGKTFVHHQSTCPRFTVVQGGGA